MAKRAEKYQGGIGMKKVFAVLMSLMLVITMIPAVAFAGGDIGDNLSAFEQTCLSEHDVGDILFPGTGIANIMNFDTEGGAINCSVEIKLSKPLDSSMEEWVRAEEWVYENNMLSRNAVVDVYGAFFAGTPVFVVVEEIIIDEATRTLKYVLREIGKVDLIDVPLVPNEWTEVVTNKEYREGHEYLFKVKNNVEQTLTANVIVYDGDNVRPELGYTSTAAGGETLSGEYLDFPTRIKGCNYDENENIINILLEVYPWNKMWISVNNLFSEVPQIYNYLDKPLLVRAEVYEDNALQTKDETFVFEEYAQPYVSLEYPGNTSLYPLSKEMTLIEIVDETLTDNPALILKFSKATMSDTLPENQMKEFLKPLLDPAEEQLANIENTKLHMKIADPTEMGIEGYGESEAKQMMLKYPVIFELGLQEIILEKDAKEVMDEDGARLFTMLYSDKSLKKQIYPEFDKETGTQKFDVEENKTYYLQVGYSVRKYNSTIKKMVSTEVFSDELIEISFEFVEPQEKAVAQIKKSAALDLEYKIDDLSWINTLVSCGFETWMPSVSNPDAILKVQNDELYKKMVGDTDLDILLTFGAGGDHYKFITNYRATPVYMLDDVYYFAGTTGKNLSAMYLGQVMYVPEGTTDRAKAAEQRIEKFLGEGAFEVNVQKLDSKVFIDYFISATGLSYGHLEKNLGIITEEIRAMYLMEDGVAFYSHETLTDKDHFLGLARLCIDSAYKENLFKNSGLEEVATLEYVYSRAEYINKTNVKAYMPYGVTLTNIETKESKDMLYAIGIGTEDQLKEPYADWKDDETGIVTKGENGYVPFDAHTKIRVIKNGTEIKFIQDKVGDDKKVHAYDINAYTNFKGGKLTDLGDGRMKVMIPLGVLSEDGVKAHYVDDQGNVQNLEYTIEEYEGEKYVCFITNHFSTYAISGIEAKVPADGTDKTPTQDQTKPETPTTPETGDNSYIMNWALVAAVAAFGALALRKKEN